MLWWVLPGALVIGAAAWGTAQWLLQGLPQLPIPQQVSTRIEALRTALAAAAGVGAGVTLLLAVRRQRHQEVATWHTTHDAAERRVTELYTKAVEQLGNAQAPVRLGGLYALERLAQDSPALRQTVVDVVCAYLRMPYQLPDDEKPEREPRVPRPSVGGVTKSLPAPKHDPHEERQVRVTAQRILAAHLRYQVPVTHTWWRPRATDPNVRHWADQRLDLTGATLLGLDLSNCRIGPIVLDNVTFTGDARFDDTTFGGDVDFSHITFTGHARFDGATFTGDARFDGATFTCGTKFSYATFIGSAGFDSATFDIFADFGHVTFVDVAWFNDTTFSGDADFGYVSFTEDARFDNATFTGEAWFNDTTFTEDAMFEDATFTGEAWFSDVTFIDDVDFVGATWQEKAMLMGAQMAPVEGRAMRALPATWRAVAGADGWQMLRLATPEELAQADGAENPSGNG
ncbi:pentapeptide repeat-containing protein [Nonomuraea sp. NPDC059023]|uniref:pentapeptide repeat-containing protein n=1 Tax=unclassified Nonomuraea TaxID=2593643 RepID=UPI0036777BBA